MKVFAFVVNTPHTLNHPTNHYNIPIAKLQPKHTLIYIIGGNREWEHLIQAVQAERTHRQECEGTGPLLYKLYNRII